MRKIKHTVSLLYKLPAAFHFTYNQSYTLDPASHVNGVQPTLHGCRVCGADLP